VAEGEEKLVFERNFKEGVFKNQGEEADCQEELRVIMVMMS